MSVLWFHALQEYEYAMRVDEDVFITSIPRGDLFALLSSDYAFGLETTKYSSIESHKETVATVNPWIDKYISGNKQASTGSAAVAY